MTADDFLSRAAQRFAPPTIYSAVELMRSAGMEPDPWQRDLLEAHPDRALLLCSRQAGKSMTTAAMSLEQALTKPGSVVLLVSASQRQSAELLGKVRLLAMSLAVPLGMEQLSVLSMKLANGSRIISLPGRAEVIRGYSADLLVLDEAAWIPDNVYESVRPMLAVSGGRLVGLSTPFGRRGWFHTAWESAENWHRVKVTADEVPRITDEFLEDERRYRPANVFAAEYMCEFTDTLDAVFSSDDVQEAVTDEVQPLFATAAAGTVDSNIIPLFPDEEAAS